MKEIKRDIHLNRLACALGTCTAFPTRDDIGAGTLMYATVFDGIALTGIIIDMHAFGAFTHDACRIYAFARCPAVHGQTARDAMGAAIVEIVDFACIFIQMQASLTCADVACPMFACTI